MLGFEERIAPYRSTEDRSLKAASAEGPAKSMEPLAEPSSST